MPARTVDTVATRRTSHRLRASRHTAGGLIVEAGGPSPGWRRVDDRVPTLTRAASRVLAVDRDEAQWFARRANELVGSEAVDPSPVAAIVRAAYPLLGRHDPFPTPAIPASIPVRLQPAFRQQDPREAAHLLFPQRATRPVVRSLCDLLTRDGQPVDMWTLSLTASVAGDLEPDHVARILQAAPGSARLRDPVPEDLLATFVRLVRPLSVARRVAVTEAAVGDPETRRRVAYVLQRAPAALCPHPRGAACWQVTASSVATGTGIEEHEVADDPDPEPPADVLRFTVHRARSMADLRRLARTLDNCIDSYGNELARGEPLLEIREHGTTRYAIHVRDGRITEFKGYKNRVPRPDDVTVVRDLLQRHGLLRSPTRPQPRDPVVRLQDLAADLLGPPRIDRVDWTEFAAALWCLGHLPRLPEPDDPTWEQVIRDLAVRAAAGERLPMAGRPPTAADRHRRAAELHAEINPRRHVGWQRRMVAAMLRADVRR